MMLSPHESTNVDLSVSIGSLRMRNPVTVASGTFGSGRDYSDFIDLEHLGALVTKGVSAVAWEGNSGRRVYETASGMLNSIGLQNPGVEAFIKNDLAWLKDNAPTVPVIVNVSGHSVEQYVEVIERLEDQSQVSAYEINISCPNVDAGGLAFGTNPGETARITTACRAATQRPLIMKLSPNVTSIDTIACICEDAGADAISLINTLLGMAIDIHTQRFVFDRKVAGLSGPAIKPVALRMVNAVANTVTIPVIGIGGILTADDAIEFMLAGAKAVAVGTGNFIDPQATVRCIEGIGAYCARHEIPRATDLIGAVKE